jgi:hypothetical protein
MRDKWHQQAANTGHQTRIYTVEQNGALYETDTRTGAWKQIGKAEFGKAKFMCWSSDSLYIIEDDGLFRMNPFNGFRTAIGK